MDKLSYALGLGIGRQLAQMGAKDMNIDDFAMAIRDVIEGNDLKESNQPRGANYRERLFPEAGRENESRTG